MQSLICRAMNLELRVAFLFILKVPDNFVNILPRFFIIKFHYSLLISSHDQLVIKDILQLELTCPTFDFKVRFGDNLVLSGRLELPDSIQPLVVIARHYVITSFVGVQRDGTLRVANSDYSVVLVL